MIQFDNITCDQRPTIFEDNLQFACFVFHELAVNKITNVFTTD